TWLFFGKEATHGYGPMVLSILFYYCNWRLCFHPGPHHGEVAHCWSLSIEEQFYFVWPAAFLLLLKFRVPRRWVIGLVLLGCMTSVVLRVVLWGAEGGPARVYLRTDTRLDGILAGCL